MINGSTAKISRTRDVITYSELWDGSTFLYKQARGERPGSYWAVMSCAVLTAFTVEAYLNHVGPVIFKSESKWDKYERHRAPVEKLATLCERCGVAFPPHQKPPHPIQRPRRSIQELFDFRKLLAHGRNEFLRPPDVIEDIDKISDPYALAPLTTDWEKYCSSIENIERVREDVEQVICSIQEKVLPNEPPFRTGPSTQCVELPARGNEIRSEIPRLPDGTPR